MHKGDELEYLMNALSDDAVAPNDISLEKNDGTVGMHHLSYLYPSMFFSPSHL